jgi:DNA-binding NtrC family response regulator
MMAAKVTVLPISGRETQLQRSASELTRERRVRTLFVGESPEDHKQFCRIAGGPQWHVSSVSRCAEAIAHLTWQRVPVVVCESRLADGSWRDILGYAAQYAVQPALIVAAPRADHRLLAEVAGYGGFGVLRKPFHGREVRRAIACAWRHGLREIQACSAGASDVTEMPQEHARSRATVRFLPFRAN